MADDQQYQYVKMPDGSYGKFRADATDDDIKGAVLKDFPSAYAANQAHEQTKSIIPPPSTNDKIADLAESKGVMGANDMLAPVSAFKLAPALRGLGGSMLGGETARLLHAPGWVQTGAAILGGGLGLWGGGDTMIRPAMRNMASKVVGEGPATSAFPITASEQVKNTMPIGERLSTLKPWGEKPYVPPPLNKVPMEQSPIGPQLNPPGAISDIPTRMPRSGPTPISPPTGATLTSQPLGTATLPSPASGSVTSTGSIEPLPTPPPQGLSSGLGKSRIVSPDSPPPHVEGSYWSFDKGSLERAVLKGDRDAAVVYKQRFGELPPNAGLLTDVGSKPNKGLYRSNK